MNVQNVANVIVINVVVVVLTVVLKNQRKRADAKDKRFWIP